MFYNIVEAAFNTRKNCIILFGFEAYLQVGREGWVEGAVEGIFICI